MIDSRDARCAPSKTRRCVLWQRAAGDPPQALLGGLAARGIEVEIAWHAPGTMLAVVRRPSNVLIIVGAPDDAAEGELLAAVRAYQPRVLRWRYDPVGGGLAPIDDGDDAGDGISAEELAMLVGPEAACRRSAVVDGFAGATGENC